MKDSPSEPVVELCVAPVGSNWGPGNDDDDYLSIFHPSPGTLLVRCKLCNASLKITAAPPPPPAVFHKYETEKLLLVNLKDGE
jgi:hypothetical protein